MCMQTTYTGVYARGGPTNVDTPHDLSEITNRKPADNRGRQLAPVYAHAHTTSTTPVLTPRHATSDAGTTPRAFRSSRLSSRVSSGRGSFGGGLLSPSLSCTGTLTTPNQEASRSGALRGTPRAGRLSTTSLASPFGEKSGVSPSTMQLPGWENLGTPPRSLFSWGVC